MSTIDELYEDVSDAFTKYENQPPGVVIPTPDQDNAILALQFCKDKLIRKLAKLQPTNNGQYYPDDIDQFVKVAKAIVGEMDK